MGYHKTLVHKIRKREKPLESPNKIITGNLKVNPQPKRFCASTLFVTGQDLRAKLPNLDWLICSFWASARMFRDILHGGYGDQPYQPQLTQKMTLRVVLSCKLTWNHPTKETSRRCSAMDPIGSHLDATQRTVEIVGLVKAATLQV